MEDGTDLSGVTLRDCMLRGTRFPNAWVEDVSITGMVLGLVVNGVDVTAYVDAELDRRHPERVQAREATTAEELRAAWARIQDLWSQTVNRAEQLPEADRFERVEGEWSVAETLRHLVFATDAWVGRTILDREASFHPYGLNHTEYPADAAAALGLDADARPTWNEVRAARRDRQRQVDEIFARLEDADLERACPRSPAPGYPEEHPTVGQCLQVVLGEECEHRRYAERDLALLESRQLEGPRGEDGDTLTTDAW